MDPLQRIRVMHALSHHRRRFAAVGIGEVLDNRWINFRLGRRKNRTLGME